MIETTKAAPQTLQLGISYFAIPGFGSLELTNLIYIVSQCTKVDVAVIRSKDQTRGAANARHLFSLFARSEYHFTFQYIADYLKRASHSTIKKSVQQAMNFRETDREFAQLCDTVEEMLQSNKAVIQD